MNSELGEHLFKTMLPMYDGFDRGHNKYHFFEVWRDSSLLNNILGKPYTADLITVSAMYHDIGLSVGREKHHMESGKIVRADDELKKFFSPSEIELIAQACEDHRSSAKLKPRSMLGCIIADADSISVYRIDRVIVRLNSTRASIPMPKRMKSAFDHVHNKIGTNGYAKLWLSQTEAIFKANIVFARHIADNRDMFEDCWHDVLKL